MSQKVVDKITSLAQAAADIGYDGAINKDGTPVKIGLKREQGHPIYGSRVMDGFNISVSGQTLILSYHTDVRLREIYNQDFETEVGRMMAKIIKELKKRFKSNTGKGITLTKQGDPSIRVESSSRARCWATARCTYKIGDMENVEDVASGDGPPPLEKEFKKFLSQGGNKHKL